MCMFWVVAEEDSSSSSSSNGFFRVNDTVLVSNFRLLFVVSKVVFCGPIKKKKVQNDIGLLLC